MTNMRAGPSRDTWLQTDGDDYVLSACGLAQLMVRVARFDVQHGATDGSIRRSCQSKG